MKIDLGGGRKPKKGFINIDKWEGHYDIYCDFEKGSLPFKDKSVDEVYTHHMLEHLPYSNKDGSLYVDIILKECFRVMKIGAKIDLTVPDFEEACRQFLAGNIPVAFMMTFSGKTDNPYDWHHSGYSTEMLTKAFERNGFIIESIDSPEWYGKNIHIKAVK